MTLLNVLLVLVVTAYLVFDIYQRRKKLTCMTAMMIAMTIGMMVSISLGVLLGIYFNHDLTKSTILAVVVGMISGYAAGKPVSLMAALDGMLAGIMGGMMGAMLGVMLVVPITMVWFVNVIFIAVMFVLIQLMDDETGASKSDRNQVKNSFFGSVGLAVALVAVAGLLLVFKGNLLGVTQASSSQSSAGPSAQEQIMGDVQEATINVSSSGYGPQNLDLKAGIPAKVNFKTENGAGCLRQVVSKELGLNNILSEEGDNYITLKNLKPGTYPYTCGMGMYGGTVTVK